MVQTLDADQLRRDGISDIRLLQAAIPGLNIANQEGNVEIYIRGVGSSNNTELGDPAAAPHFNGNYIARPRGLSWFYWELAASFGVYDPTAHAFRAPIKAALYGA